ncbi:MAG: 4-alpha-glucanotransferase [Aquificaceae bacterium]|nr:4-alpha-glucanotransferase [Aquificaceae bacterium]
MERLAGVLLHISSLPSDYGIGDLGPSAYRFVDFLAGSGQSLWQVLPLNPTELAHGNSPYFSQSLFAGNFLFISPELMYEDGLLKSSHLEALRSEAYHRVDYTEVYRKKEHMLSLAFENFKGGEDFERFCEREAFWLEEYSRFKVIGDRTKKPWWHWSGEEKPPERELLREKFVQFVFFRQWERLKNYANSKGVRLVGDLPIYPAHDSVEVWANRELFKLREDGLPALVAGVPPDYFSKTGQLWGNPVYNWENLKERGFDWWLQRIRHSLKLFDLLRFDHFRGFSAFYQVPYGEKTAERGWWERAPGYELFEKVKEEFPDMPFLAEDLGTIDREVIELRERYQLPGMKVLVFAFFDRNSTHLPHNHTYNSVVYTSTHDTMPIKGWFYQEIEEYTRAKVLDYLGYAPEDISQALVRLAYMSVAKYCIIPMQDILGLGGESRMNTPGRIHGNWEWRMKNIPSEGHREFLLFLCETYGRLAN